MLPKRFRISPKNFIRKEKSETVTEQKLSKLQKFKKYYMQQLYFGTFVYCFKESNNMAIKNNSE